MFQQAPGSLPARYLKQGQWGAGHLVPDITSSRQVTM